MEMKCDEGFGDNEREGGEEEGEEIWKTVEKKEDLLGREKLSR